MALTDREPHETDTLLFDRDDALYLRSELLMRMKVQNGVLILNAILFLSVAALQTSRFCAAAPLGLAYTITAFVLAAIWCHHGARQAQIKQYLLLLQQRQSVNESWESWLPRNRIGGRLGARWVISTKLPFLATTLAACLLGCAFDPEAWIVPMTVANMLSIAMLAALLWTNPKEGLPMQ